MQLGFTQDFKNVFQRPNNEYVRLIVINVIVFVVFELIGVFTYFGNGREAIDVGYTYFGMPSDLSELVYRLWTPFTYMFVHSGFWHILWNMVLLYWFGKILADYLGGPKVVNLYVLGGLMGALVYLVGFPLLNTLIYPDQEIRAILVGASGAVLAVVVGTATLMPNYAIFLLFLGPVRIKYIALVVSIMSIIGLRGDNMGGELAHLGGILMGVIYIKQLQAGNDWGVWIQNTIRAVEGIFKPERKIKVTHRKESKSSRGNRGPAPSRKTASSEASQEEIDAILDKISERGYESLTKEEKQKLFNASKH
jgi:membrane associated rhomboid family serine protease